VLEHVDVWGLAVANLFFGGALAIMAVAGYVKERLSCAGAVVLLSAGTALMVVGLLHLLDIVGKEWVLVNWFMVLGILLVMENAGILSFGLTGGMRKWLAVVFGVVMILWAVLKALGAVGGYGL
jgi:hypothetical protein